MSCPDRVLRVRDEGPDPVGGPRRPHRGRPRSGRSSTLRLGRVARRAPARRGRDRRARRRRRSTSSRARRRCTRSSVERASDPEVGALLRENRQARRSDQRQLVGRLHDAGTVPLRRSTSRTAADAVYAILNEEVYQLLVVDCGWTLERFRPWLSELAPPAADLDDRAVTGCTEVEGYGPGPWQTSRPSSSWSTRVRTWRWCGCTVRTGSTPCRSSSSRSSTTPSSAMAEENDTWVVVLTGSGRAFSSGLDLKDHGIVPNIDGLQVGRIAQRAMRHYSRLVPRLRRMPQPVIAAVNGPAYGGGMCLALGADLRFAAESATFNSTGIVNGLTSTELGASWLLPRLIGVARSNDLLLTGRVVDAGRRARHGSRLPGAPRRRAARRLPRRGRVDGPVQPLRPRHDQGRAVGEPRGEQPRGSGGAGGSQPAHARVHREPARGHPSLRCRSCPPVHR